MSLLAKLKILTELCHNIKVTEEQSINDISSLVDDAILIGKEKLNSVNDVLIERDETAKKIRNKLLGRKKKEIG